MVNVVFIKFGVATQIQLVGGLCKLHSFAAASGIASDYIMWNVTSVAVEKLLERGITPGILKSANFPGGNDYNKTVIEPNFEKYGY